MAQLDAVGVGFLGGVSIALAIDVRRVMGDGLIRDQMVLKFSAPAGIGRVWVYLAAESRETRFLSFDFACGMASAPSVAQIFHSEGAT